MSYCATHAGIETALSCGRCETAYCPKCLIQGPVGTRCRACAGDGYRESAHCLI